MQPRSILIGSTVFGAGLGLGVVAAFALTLTDKPTIIMETRWKTVTTAPTPQLDIGHTSLNPDELKTLLNLEKQPDNIYYNPNVLPSQQVLSPCVPPTATTPLPTTSLSKP